MITNIIREEKLTRMEVDIISEKLDELLSKSDTDKQNALRIRLTLENLILYVCEELGEETRYTLSTGKVLGRQFIRFSYQGIPYDPCRITDGQSDSQSNWSQRIMSDMGLSPVWHYNNGVNTLELKLKRKRMGNMQAILLSIAIAAVCGFSGAALLPDNIKEGFSDLLFKPMQSLFFHIMSTFAGIMILLSVSCGIFNMGNISSFSKIGKVMFRRFIGITVMLAAGVSAICYFLFPTLSDTDGSAGINKEGISKILDLIYDIVPGDPVTPFATGNAMQVVLIGIIVGITILFMGDNANSIKTVAEELNSMINSILSGICRLLPLYIFFIIINMIWCDTFRQMINIWKPFVTLLVMNAVMLTFMVFYISIKYKVSAVTIVKKLLPTFLVCITTASTISAFGQTVNDCVEKFGIDKKYMKVVHPIKCIIYMPGVIVMLIVMIFSMANIYDVKTNISWIILGILMSSILTIAVPPIPGALAMLFGILFSQMGIPAEAMAFAVTCDVFYDFLDTATNNTVGILEYVLQADKLDMLDIDKLRAKV